MFKIAYVDKCGVNLVSDMFGGFNKISASFSHRLFIF